MGRNYITAVIVELFEKVWVTDGNARRLLRRCVEECGQSGLLYSLAVESTAAFFLLARTNSKAHG
jgi:hypothetical protein